MLGHARELEKNMVYAQPDWDSPKHRIKSIKKGKALIVVTNQDGQKVELDPLDAVRFWEPGREPKHN